MKIDDKILITDLGSVEQRIRELIVCTLAPLQPVMDVIAVRVFRDDSVSMVSSGVQCTIEVDTTGGRERVEVCDDDEMIAVYRALTLIVDRVRPQGGERKERMQA